jgi:hypothetical protein
MKGKSVTGGKDEKRNTYVRIVQMSVDKREKESHYAKKPKCTSTGHFPILKHGKEEAMCGLVSKYGNDSMN